MRTNDSTTYCIPARFCDFTSVCFVHPWQASICLSGAFPTFFKCLQSTKSTNRTYFLVSSTSAPYNYIHRSIYPYYIEQLLSISMATQNYIVPFCGAFILFNWWRLWIVLVFVRVFFLYFSEHPICPRRHTKKMRILNCKHYELVLDRFTPTKFVDIERGLMKSECEPRVDLFASIVWSI